MRFAKWVFTLAGVWGFLVLTPLYFAQSRIGRDSPPAITHPEFFYGFIGVALAFQVVFFVIGRDPLRHRALMVPSILEKLAFAVPAAILFLHGQLASQAVVGGMIDLLLGALFAISFVKTGADAGHLQSERRISAHATY